jgi:hypothetical protein
MRSLLLRAGLSATRISAVVDRVESDWAVVEIAPFQTADMPLHLLPRGLHEGDRLHIRIGRRHLRVRIQRPKSTRSNRAEHHRQTPAQSRATTIRSHS